MLKKVFNKKFYIWITSILVVLALIFGGFAVYVSDYYKADINLIRDFAVGKNVTKTVISDGVIAYGNPNAETGFIFYPGGKVEYTAYEPLMLQLAQNNVFCVLLKMPFNLAVLDINAAYGIQEKYPEIKNWYIGGHSLGGSMAASYIANHTKEFKGIVLLGAYSTKDISKDDLCVLSLFGSQDKIMNKEKYEKYKNNLPQDLSEIIIQGGNHAYFGTYGKQDGDGEATISNFKQIEMTADYIIKFILQGEN